MLCIIADRKVWCVHIAWASTLLVLDRWARSKPQRVERVIRKFPRFCFIYGIDVKLLMTFPRFGGYRQGNVSNLFVYGNSYRQNDKVRIGQAGTFHHLVLQED